MSSNTPAPPPRGIVEEMIGLSFGVALVANMPTMPIISLIPYLLSNVSLANEILSHMLPPPKIVPTLQMLNSTLPMLPADDTRKEMDILYGIVLAVSLTVVSLRFYVRRFVTPKLLRAEDWTCLAALLMVVVFNALLLAQNRYGHTGEHLYLLNLHEVRAWSYWNTITGMAFGFTHLFVKFTFLVFYWRLYPNRRFRWCVGAVGAFVALVTASGVLVMIFQCRPIDWWNHLATAKCVNRMVVFTISSVWFVLADFMILFLPLPIVFRLRLPLSEKLLLAGLFSLGGLISIISILRMIAQREWLSSPDFTYAFGKQVIYASLEILLSLIVCCAPALKLLFHSRKRGAGAGPEAVAGASKFIFGPDGLFKRSSPGGSLKGRGGAKARSRGLFGSLFTDGAGAAKDTEAEREHPEGDIGVADIEGGIGDSEKAQAHAHEVGSISDDSKELQITGSRDTDTSGSSNFRDAICSGQVTVTALQPRGAPGR